LTAAPVSLRYPRAYTGYAAYARRAATAALDRLGLSNVALTVVLTDEAGIRDLNLQYAEDDRVTDVLSFPSEATDPQTGVRYLGDVIVAVPVAESQAPEAGHEVRAEIDLLVVHGVLHLLGFDHADPADREAMWSIQAAILDDRPGQIPMPGEEHR
jgi:probable rRNA maturation factor